MALYALISFSLEVLNCCSDFFLKKEYCKSISNVLFLSLFWEGELLWRQLNYSSYIKAWFWKKYQMLLRLSNIPVSMMTEFYGPLFRESFKFPCHIHFGDMVLHTKSFKILGFLVSFFDMPSLCQKRASFSSNLSKSHGDFSPKFNLVKIKYLLWYAFFMKFSPPLDILQTVLF